MKLQPVERDSALSLGGIMHEGFDLFYKGGNDRQVYDFINAKFEAEKKRKEVIDQEDILINQFIALGMWLNYPWKNTKEFEEIVSEEAFSVPLCDGVIFVGKVDGRLKQSGNYWVRELKTSGLSKRQFEGRSQVSGQATGYVFGLSQYNIKGIFFEYIRKPTLRKGVQETAEIFGRRLQADYRTRPGLYYNRHYSYRTPVDLMHFKQDMTTLAQDILEKIEKKEFYRNVDSCWDYNRECEYAKICFAEEPDPLTLELYFTRKEDK
jgi:hypothetical protein